MPKISTFPTLFDEVLKINISKLKSWGYLKKGICITDTMTWTRRGEKTGSISITFNMVDNPRIVLDYTYKGKPRKYEIEIIYKPSNLKKGKVPFFRCPHTRKLCRNLYCINGYFLHRDAHANSAIYESQTYSKNTRNLLRIYGPYFNAERLYSELNQKYFKKTYNGKPTKRYLRIRKQLDRYEAMSVDEINRMFLR